MFSTFENKIQRNSNMRKTKVGREKNIDNGSLSLEMVTHWNIDFVIG